MFDDTSLSFLDDTDLEQSFGTQDTGDSDAGQQPQPDQTPSDEDIFKYDSDSLPEEAREAVENVKKQWQSAYTKKRQSETQQIKDLQSQIEQLKGAQPPEGGEEGGGQAQEYDTSSPEYRLQVLEYRKEVESLAKPVEQGGLPFFKELIQNGDMVKVLEQYPDISYKDAWTISIFPYLSKAYQEKTQGASQQNSADNPDASGGAFFVGAKPTEDGAPPRIDNLPDIFK